MFKIVVVGGPAEKYVERCMESILSQKEEFQAQVVLDPVGDNTYELAKKYECDKLKVTFSSNRVYALPNIIRSINLLDCSDEDVIVTVDADDWLYSSATLSKVKQRYDQDPNLLVTYGSWKGFPDHSCRTNCRPYSAEEFRKGLRHYDWKGTHLRTFKYKVWKHVNHEDLKDAKGDYFKTSWDIAMMWPMLEMAGYHRTLFINEPLYVYNMETPFNDFKLYLSQQMYLCDYMAAMKPYLYKESL